MPTLSYKGAFCINRLLLVGLLINSVSFSAISHATELKKVDQVVATEAAGKPIDRRATLADQTDDISQWQSGRILIDGQWMDIEELQSHKRGSQSDSYLQERDAIKELNVEGHRHLAKWCQSHQLPEMAKVHWKAVVAVAVDDEQARKALGHKRIGNNWLSKDELKQAGDDRKQEKTWLAEWMPQIRKIVAKLQSSDAETKLVGMNSLRRIDTVAAVAALKYGALQLEPTLAVPLVSQIKAIRSKNSCLALCEIAINDPKSESGRLALEGLMEYDSHLYVPELLQMLELPVELKQRFFYMPNGTFVLHNAYHREMMSSKEQNDTIKLLRG